MNVVFDLGGVLLDWRPDAIINAFHADSTVRTLLASGLFRHDDWLSLDRGEMTYDEVIPRAAARTGLEESLFREVLARLPDALTIQRETLALVDEVVRRGHRSYVLSNMHAPVAREIEHRYEFWDRFDGVVFSCDVGAIKPDLVIYRTLLDRWSLRPDETVFLDDAHHNVAAAAKLGIDAILFRDAVDARREFAVRGIVPA
jgi:putative hydrolase of the HAD superfamily